MWERERVLESKRVGELESGSECGRARESVGERERVWESER